MGNQDHPPLETSRQKSILLVGNPNVGKSVLFNTLTGAYTTVSNYPGTSVEVSHGQTEIDDTRYDVHDTPGMYSLLPITEEESVARRMLLKDRADIVLHVIDARNLERMLPMTLQLVEAGLPVILVVNIIDEAERLGMKIDVDLLQEKLGIPVVAAAMAHKRGLKELRETIARYDGGNPPAFAYSADLENDIASIGETLRSGDFLSRRALALLLLQRDEEVEAHVRQNQGADGEKAAEQARAIAFDRRSDLHLRISMERNRICKGILSGVIQHQGRGKPTFSERLSDWMMNPWTGVPILLLIVYFGLYRFVGSFGAGTIVDFLEGSLFEGHVTPWLVSTVEAWIPWYWLRELLAGEYGVLTLALRYAVALVLPIVGTFFLAFSMIEDTGYFPRLAMLVDRLFKRIGLNGRAVIPMVLGFGCDTMATMVTRTLETVRERVIATILLALAVPCSAQLGVILGLLSAEQASLLIWTACMVLIFLLIGLLSSMVIPGDRPMFYMEIPPLRLPQLRNVLVKTLTRMQSYFVEILPLFIYASIFLWAGKMTGLLGGLVRAMEPVMGALGLPVEASAAFIFGFFRRDFGAAGLYDLHSSGQLDAVQLTVAAVTLTLFVPCIAQFLMMKKERGWKVSLGIFLFVTLLAFSTGWMLNAILRMGGFTL